MMKQILIIALLFMVSEGAAQTKREYFNKAEIGFMLCNTQNIINIDEHDTISNLVISFQNAEHLRTMDYKYVIFDITHDSTELKVFRANLSSALNEMDKGQTIEWDKSKYRISLIGENKGIFFCEASSKGRGYTILYYKDVEKLIAWIDTILK